MATSIEGIDLRGQVAIVTGGGRGIGRAMARALARAGAAVAVAARTQAQLAETVALIEREGGRAIAVPTDVADERGVHYMVDQAETHLGPVDLLVANAAIAGPGGPAWEVDPGEWWRCLEVNLYGPHLCSRAVLPGMVRRGHGRIVITASGAGCTLLLPYASAYSITKCAVIRLAEFLAAEAQSHHISVFSIDPGSVRTALTETAAAMPEDERWLGGFFRKTLEAGYDSPPERAAELVVYLASGKADALSGCFLTIKQDIAELAQHADEIQRDGRYRLWLKTGPGEG